VYFLERLLGKKMDWDKLSELLDSQDKVFRIWWEINELRKAKPGPLHSRDFYTCMISTMFLAQEKEALEGSEAVLEEVKARVDGGIGALSAEEKYRLMFAELPPWHSLSFFDRLAERGWNFVIESVMYKSPPPLDMRVTDPLERIARVTLGSLQTFAKGFLEGEVARGAALALPYLNFAREFKVDGMVIHPLISCRTGTVFLLHIKDMLMEQLKVPTLIVPGDMVDLTVFDLTRALSEAEAFEDTMEHYREVRKKEGLDW
jgi:benzoyl-CoA reductase/2-hydroxyglutaryl-CoA dehydratase subunit BcrC/BadD/HgdB